MTQEPDRNFSQPLQSALAETISAHGTDRCDLNTGIAMGVALVAHPEGVISEFLERDITDAVASDQPVKMLEELLSILSVQSEKASYESIVVNAWGAVALAIREALEAHEIGNRRKYHVQCGVAIGISRALELNHFRTRTPLDAMISDGVTSDNLAKLQEVRRFCNTGFRMSTPAFASEEVQDKFDHDFDQMSSRIMSCGVSDIPGDGIADNRQPPRGPLNDPSDWITLNRSARSMNQDR